MSSVEYGACSTLPYTGVSPLSLRACNLQGTHYKFTADLLSLECEYPTPFPDRHPLPESLSTIITPIHTDQWCNLLYRYLNRDLVNYLFNGFSHKFRIGYHRTDSSTVPRQGRHNMQSAREHLEVVSAYLDTEREMGRIVGPVEPAQLQGTDLQIMVL